LATKNLAQISSELTEAVESLEGRQRQIRAITRSLETPVNSNEDDLTHIKGVKGPINDQLRSLGVRTYRQIALWSDEDASAFGELLAIKKNATRDLWRPQARELHLAKHGTEPS
jgi:predicted flap endonuclease-1-like 5' DNA nuclease